MVLQFINEQMEALGIPYEFGEWTSSVVYPYTVGEYTEPETMTEDGAREFSFILTGFHRGEFQPLEEIKEKIRKQFNPISGKRTATKSGAIAVFYVGAFPVKTGEAELKRIQINLKIKTWEGVL